MSNGEVKRWQAPHMMRYRLPAERESETDHATEAYALPCSVVLASDHERIVAEKDAAYNKLDDINIALNEKIATQRRIINVLADCIVKEDYRCGNWPEGRKAIARATAIDRGET